MRITIETLAAVFALAVGIITGPATAEVAAADADDYPLPLPQPLAPGEPGAVILAEPLTTSAALPSAARNFLVIYHSRDLEGRDVAVSGALAIPPGEPPQGGWPIVTWTHGTTGIVSACAPSRDTPEGPEHTALSQKQRLLDGYVQRGFAVAATDYQGLGTPGLHPFLQGIIEGRGAVDIVRAAREIDPSIAARYVVMGHSQGGHADLFAASLGRAYAPELTLIANVAFAPASHIGETLTGMAQATSPSLRLGYTMYVLQSFASNHPDIDIGAILTPSAMENLPRTLDTCITELVSSGYWSTAIPKDQFRPDAALEPALAVAAANDPSTLAIEVPTLILQGTADDTVMPAWTDAVVRGLCKRGAPVSYMVYPGASHETVVDEGADTAAAWIADRFLNRDAPTNCDDLPAAAE